MHCVQMYILMVPPFSFICHFDVEFALRKLG
jgi:hypothetical protein